MNAVVTEPEVLTPEQEEAALQELLDKADAKRFGEPEPEAKPEETPDPMKLVVEDEPDKEAASIAAKPAEIGTNTDTSEPAKPAAEPATPAASDAAPAAAAVAEQEDDILAKLPENVRQLVKDRLDREAAEKAKLAQDNRSMAGRVSAYQRRYEEAKGLRQPAATPAATPEQKNEWNNFVSEYPEIAKAIEAKFAATLPEGQAAKTAELIAYVEAQKQEAFLRDAWAAIDAVHPTWRVDGRTKEFQEWKKSSPAYEKLAASDDISDAIALFDLYNAHKGTVKSTTTPATPAPAAAAAPAAPASTAAADQVAARREKQAEGAASPSGKPAAPNHGVDMSDPDQLFEFYAKRADSRLRR